ncbi:fimbria/pilus outer membrane usher protein [Collimonas humicola]|uniref:fimbria/pilus outer membrane usher protein n=1 Tax=Collimonas humicola TaxID=2825886 RepID=UPI001B8D90F8|nr:fimbria/pilus outer membrane usher protein [Collimonas humicola]
MAILLFFPSVLVIAANNVKPNDKSFDRETLKARGFSPDIAFFFKDEKRFNQGGNYVTLFVNGIKVGRAHGQFDEQGKLCADADFLGRADIIVPPRDHLASCIDLHKLYPQTIVRLHPSREEVELIVPQNALRVSTGLNVDRFIRGGTAGLLNYELAYMKDASKSGNTTILANTETGLNVFDWMLRSRQTYSRSRRGKSISHLGTHVQKTVPGYKSVFQAGQINVADTQFNMPSLLGMQFFPEGALLEQAGNSTSVDGIAQTVARVEVRQSGALIYSTVVPPGPFSLTSLMLNNASEHLEVSVIEEDGRKRSFIVPVAALAFNYVPRERNFSIALGRPIRYGDESNYAAGNNWLVTARANLPFDNRSSIAASALLAPRYYSLGAQYIASIKRGVVADLNHLLAYSAGTMELGMQATLNVSVQLSERLSASGSYSYRTKKFRTFSDTWVSPYDAPIIGGVEQVDSREFGYKQMNFIANYQHSAIGSVALNYSQFGGGQSVGIRQFGLRWGRNFKKKNVSVSIDRSTGVNRDLMVYAGLSIPFGSGSLNSAVSRNNRRQAVTFDYSDRINEYASYRLSADGGSTNRSISNSAGLSILPKYAQASVNVGSYGAGGISYSGQISGGLVAHGDGITLSPYRVQDTFALMTVPGLSDVKIQTPQGPVWTDLSGRAVAPYMPPYQEARLELVTKSLPKNTDVKNGVRMAGLARGAVSNMTFGVVSTRRVLLKIVDHHGKPADKGASIFDENGAWIASIGTGGTTLLTAEQLKQSLRVTNIAGSACFIDVELPEYAAVDSFYERTETVCRQAI